MHSPITNISTQTLEWLSWSVADDRSASLRDANRGQQVFSMNHQFTYFAQRRVLVKHGTVLWRFQQLMPNGFKVLRVCILLLRQMAGEFQTGLRG